MPRTKGAKNKPKSKNYLLAELDKLGVKYTIESVENIGQIETPETPENSPENPPEVSPKKSQFEIAKPKKVDPPNIEGEIYRCGNPACGKILDSPVSVCPFCGVNLKWQ